MGKAARKAAAVLARTPTAVKAEALRAAARAIRAGEAAILAANTSDMARGEANGLTGALLDRLKLDPKRLEGVAAGLEAVAALPDPAGQILDTSARPNGLVLQRVRVPLGVIEIGSASGRERVCPYV